MYKMDIKLQLLFVLTLVLSAHISVGQKCVRKRQCAGTSPSAAPTLAPTASPTVATTVLPTTAFPCDSPAPWTSTTVPEPTAIIDMCTVVLEAGSTPITGKDGAALFTDYTQEGKVDASSAPCLWSPISTCYTNGFSVAFWSRNDNKGFQNYLLFTRKDWTLGLGIYNKDQDFWALVQRDDGYHYVAYNTTTDTTQWYFFTLTYDANGITLYNNGKTLSNGNARDESYGSSPNTNPYIYMSKDSDSVDESWGENAVPDYIENQVDDYYYWEQVLTAHQIAILYNLGRDMGATPSEVIEPNFPCDRPAPWTSTTVPEPTAIIDMCTVVLEAGTTPLTGKDGAALFTDYTQEGKVNGIAAPCLWSPISTCYTNGFTVAFWSRNDNKGFQNYLLFTRKDWTLGLGIFNKDQDFWAIVQRDDGYHYISYETTTDTTQWYLFTLTYDTSGITIYNNGEALTNGETRDGPWGSDPNTNPYIYMSKDSDSVDDSWGETGVPDYLENQVDDYYYWEQVLTAEQISAFYQLGRV